jgi:rhamnosyltransferase
MIGNVIEKPANKNSHQYKFSVICPTYNPSQHWQLWIKVIKCQECTDFNIIQIDSTSNDGSGALSRDAGLDLVTIPKSEFNHAGTRNRAARIAKEKYNPDILVFLTQDSLLATNDSLMNILKPFEDDRVAAVCGRQLPHDDADPIATHSRLFNYKEDSFNNSKEDIKIRGLKTAYMSNSFAAYRYTAYEESGGFPEGLIFGEDMFLAAKMILAGYKTYYAGDATVKHSHNYTLKEEFCRYFDIGVFHASQPFLLEEFGNPSGEGLKFAFSEFKYCLKHGGTYWAINSIIRTGLKFVGYKLGLMNSGFPVWINQGLSMDTNYWKK